MNFRLNLQMLSLYNYHHRFTVKISLFNSSLLKNRYFQFCLNSHSPLNILCSFWQQYLQKQYIVCFINFVILDAIHKIIVWVVFVLFFLVHLGLINRKLYLIQVNSFLRTFCFIYGLFCMLRLLNRNPNKKICTILILYNREKYDIFGFVLQKYKTKMIFKFWDFLW